LASKKAFKECSAAADSATVAPSVGGSWASAAHTRKGARDTTTFHSIAKVVRSRTPRNENQAASPFKHSDIVRSLNTTVTFRRFQSPGFSISL